MRRMMTMLMLIAAVAALTSCERYRLDHQMEELCKKDGGIKVYETVTLSPTEYEVVFNYVVKHKTQEDYYGPEYRYFSTSTHLVGKDGDAVNGGGELIRIYSRIHRSADNRLLGESVWYARGGGDFFTFGFQPSGNSCPDPRSDLAQSVFVKGE